MKPSRKLLLVYLITPGVQLVLCSHALQAQTPQFSVPVTNTPDQSLTYNATPKGDCIPDFSTVGFNYGDSPLHYESGGYQVPVIITLHLRPATRPRDGGDPTGHAATNQPVTFLSTPRLVEPCFLDRASLG